MVNKLLVFLLSLLVACSSCATLPKNRSTVESYTPQSVAGSVYLLKGYDAFGDFVTSGTAWKYAEGVLITAGHICADSDVVALSVMTADDQEFQVHRAKWSFGDGKPDVCVLEDVLKRVPGAPLKLATMPSYGDSVQYTGAPSGVFGRGVEPFANGSYIGSKYAAIPAAPGASGSPIYTKDGVIGILVAIVPGTEVTRFTPAQDVKALVESDPQEGPR